MPKKASEGTERGSTGIQSLERAAAIMDAVAASPAGITLTELSGKVALHTSTAFHLMKTLVALDLLMQDPETKKYRIGSRIFTLAAGAMNDNTLLTLGSPIIEELSVETGEGAHLAVRSRTDIVLVARAAAAGMLQMSERAGIVRPAHATAIGKILLAYAPPAERERMIASLPLPALTGKTITDRAALRAELETVLREGLAHDRCEFDPEVRCVAMPVHDFSGRCVAAIGISAPVWRLPSEVLETRLPILQGAARKLSAALGRKGD